MASFKFSFAIEGEHGKSDGEACSDIHYGGSGQPDSGGKASHYAQEVTIQPFHNSLVRSLMTSSSVYTTSGTVLRYTTAADLHRIFPSQTHNLEPISGLIGLQVPSAFKASLHSLLDLTESQNSDLISGVYEGGLKIWECAFDLVDYLAESGIQLSEMRVLELGCGGGLPGLFALKNGAKCVHFQDYNPEVIQFITIPNVLLNENGSIQNGNGTTQSGNRTPQSGDGSAQNGNRSIQFGNGSIDDGSQSLISRCRFYSGDWAERISLLSDQSNDRYYDIILTSETIYSIASQPKLLSALKQFINPTSGVVFVAAKSYYFGVGGNVGVFQDLVQRDGSFEMSTCRKIEDSVPRVILKLTPVKSH